MYIHIHISINVGWGGFFTKERIHLAECLSVTATALLSSFSSLYSLWAFEVKFLIPAT